MNCWKIQHQGQCRRSVCVRGPCAYSSPLDSRLRGNDENEDEPQYNFDEPVFVYSLKDGISDDFLTPFEFKQIIGRGIRLYDGKDYFTIYDFVKAHQYFSDPEWDDEPLELEDCPKCGNRPCVCETTNLK